MDSDGRKWLHVFAPRAGDKTAFFTGRAVSRPLLIRSNDQRHAAALCWRWTGQIGPINRSAVYDCPSPSPLGVTALSVAALAGSIQWILTESQGALMMSLPPEAILGILGPRVGGVSETETENVFAKLNNDRTTNVTQCTVCTLTDCQRSIIMPGRLWQKSNSKSVDVTKKR